MRKIIHVDMDAFYASVEQRDHPEYRGKPLAVGGSSERGVVAAASYEARKFGVFSAMSSRLAYQKCPQIIFVRARFDVYRQVSRQIREIFYEYTDLVEPLSLDEAYLDVTENKIGMPSATIIAQEIKQKIWDATQLTASAGVSVNKFLAKVASDMDKPNGLTLISPEEALDFIAQLPIQKFHGIGKVTAKKMQKLGIYTGADLRRWERVKLIRHFGKVGAYYNNIAQGIDERQVNPHRIRKSISTENTFDHDLETIEEMEAELEKLAKELLQRIDKNKVLGQTITLKVKYNNFQQITRSKTLPYAINDLALITQLYKELIHSCDFSQHKVRLLGLGVSNLDQQQNSSGLQLHLEFG